MPPVPKLIGMFVLFGGLALFSTRWAFASDATLSSPSVARSVGTSNPRTARLVCIVAAVVCWIFAAVSVIGLFAPLSGAGTH